MPSANCLPLTHPTQPNRSIRRQEQPSGPPPAATKQASGPQTTGDPHTATAPDSISYDVFSSGFSLTGSPGASHYQWAGRQLDGEPGLCSCRARHYDGTLGHWLENDPVGFDADDSNRYPYASDRPTARPTE